MKYSKLIKVSEQIQKFHKVSVADFEQVNVSWVCNGKISNLQAIISCRLTPIFTAKYR